MTVDGDHSPAVGGINDGVGTVVSCQVAELLNRQSQAVFVKYFTDGNVLFVVVSQTSLEFIFEKFENVIHREVSGEKCSRGAEEMSCELFSKTVQYHAARKFSGGVAACGALSAAYSAFSCADRYHKIDQHPFYLPAIIEISTKTGAPGLLPGSDPTSTAARAGGVSPSSVQ